MKHFISMAFLFFIWDQANPQDVTYWNVWRRDRITDPWRLEATVFEQRYKIPLDAPIAFYNVSSVYDPNYKPFTKLVSPRMK